MNRDADQILTLREVMAMTRLSKTTIYKYIKLDVFPRPVQLTPGRVGWLLSEILDWIASRKRTK